MVVDMRFFKEFAETARIVILYIENFFMIEERDLSIR